MNLYKIIVQHFAPKDSHKSVETYIVASSDEEVYGWIKSSSGLYSGWDDMEEDDMEEDDGPFDIYDADYEVIGSESFKEKMLRIKGEVNDDDLELDDLYYGKTIYGWEEVGKVNENQIKVLRELNVIANTD